MPNKKSGAKKNPACIWLKCTETLKGVEVSSFVYGTLNYFSKNLGLKCLYIFACIFWHWANGPKSI